MYNSDPVSILLMIKEDHKPEGCEIARSVKMLEVEDDKKQLLQLVRQTKLATISENVVLVSIMTSALVQPSPHAPFSKITHASLPM